MMLKEGAESESAIRLADKILNTVSRIGSIIKSLRVIARDGDRDPFEETDIETIIGDVVALSAERLKHNGVAFVQSAREPSIKVKCRSVQIAQILVNLLNNAFDAVQGSGVKRVELNVWTEGEFLKIQIVDSGPGISHENREKIFHPFFTTKGVGKGTGLGLSISRTIAEEHGGSLELERNFSPTTFTLTLPCARANDLPCKNDQAA
jgi:C4-dicarboxylate-specific signal transduction histidine kinase